MKQIKFGILVLLTLNSSWAAATINLPGGGSIKYRESLRIPFKPINVKPWADVQVTCTLTSDGASGATTSLIQVKDIMGPVGTWGSLDGKRLQGGIGDVLTNGPTTFSGAFKVIKETDYVEFINLDKVDTISVVQDSCIANPW